MRKPYLLGLIGMLTVSASSTGAAQQDNQPRAGDLICVQTIVIVTKTTIYPDGSQSTTTFSYGAGIVCHVAQ
ncbi:hypothetical protein FHS01_001140 [Longimicrobium terrae]|uniref:Secreted protein n=1 Tax=Longimicrobium terrae TaxID=1639882 RepID=A0A841GVM5_9BACT|nr:hypothetical protein [Longimicrobium terrae]MBB4635130.1 hypothetical protein [Longimicrobium terrae]MBB6069524.1 hypothetical protein [Longimicrobium terrae]NNC31674.1 hypothetical protein [Longimicrobium terrae]